MTQTEPEDDEEVSEALLPCCYFMTPILISKHRALCFQGKRRRDEIREERRRERERERRHEVCCAMLLPHGDFGYGVSHQDYFCRHLKQRLERRVRLPETAIVM